MHPPSPSTPPARGRRSHTHKEARSTFTKQATQLAALNVKGMHNITVRQQLANAFRNIKLMLIGTTETKQEHASMGKHGGDYFSFQKGHSVEVLKQCLEEYASLDVWSVSDDFDISFGEHDLGL